MDVEAAFERLRPRNDYRERLLEAIAKMSDDEVEALVVNKDYSVLTGKLE